MKINWRAAGPKQGPKGDGSPGTGARLLRNARFGRAASLALLLVLVPAWGRAGAARAGTLPAGTESVPLATQDLVEASISPHLVLPQTALWDFAFMAPYIGGGQLVCGQVNYQSAMRKYVGPQRFYAIVKHGVVTMSLLQDPPFVDTTGAEAERFKTLCDRK